MSAVSVLATKPAALVETCTMHQDQALQVPPANCEAPGAPSIETLVSQASDYHKEGGMEQAERLYKKALDLLPRSCPSGEVPSDLQQQHADVHHLLGALLIQRYGTGEFDVACQHLRKAIVLNPTAAKFRHSLGCAFEAAEKWQQAVDAYQHAVNKDPFNTKFLMSLVKPLLSLKRFMRVVEVCKSVLALDPAHERANFKCASALRQMRRQSEALLYYRRHLEHFPEDEQARFWVGILTGADVARAPASHVASLFDCYAHKFESHLIETLQYRTPDVLRDAVMSAADQVGSSMDANSACQRKFWGCCLDLGCGTGLMGPLLRECVGSLRGVDLSEKMIAKAREKGMYDELVVDDIERFLRRQAGMKSTCELLVAADVLVYLGDLAPLFTLCASVAAPGCLFALSTEQQGDEGGQGGLEDDRGYVATLTGRFQHAKEYVVRAATEAGWSLVSCCEETIRCNAGQPIAGDVFVFWMQTRH